MRLGVEQAPPLLIKVLERLPKQDRPNGGALSSDESEVFKPRQRVFEIEVEAAIPSVAEPRLHPFVELMALQRPVGREQETIGEQRFLGLLLLRSVDQTVEDARIRIEFLEIEIVGKKLQELDLAVPEIRDTRNEVRD